MPTTTTELRLGRRFRGPPGMANGGFACGVIGALVGGVAEVTLRRPLPLERPLAVPAAVSLEEAAAVAGRARYYQDPVFPDCFVCGPARSPGDGLRILPGQVLAAARAFWVTVPRPPSAAAAGAAP